MFQPKDKRTPQEKYDDMKKEIRASSHVIDRQIRALQNTLKKINADIKSQAKKNASPAVLRIKCKSYVQTQKGIERLYSVKANIESTLTQMTLQKAQIIQALAVKKGTASLEMMNNKMSAKEMMGIVHNYQREMEKYDYTSSLTEEAFNMMDDDIEAEVDEEADKVLFEVAGVTLQDLKNAGTSKLAEKQFNDAAKQTAALPSI